MKDKHYPDAQPTDCFWKPLAVVLVGVLVAVACFFIIGLWPY